LRRNKNLATLISAYFRIGCDADGWTLAYNKELPYPTFFHVSPVSEVVSVQIDGDIAIRYTEYGKINVEEPHHFAEADHRYLIPRLGIKVVYL
jgi:hypothetical protein